VYSTGIDAFTVDWHGINGLFVPPIFLITRILKYMKQCNALGTLIVQCWQSASFWDMLCPGGDGLIDQVKGHFWQCGSDFQNVSFENRFQNITDLIGDGYDA
jgi:hypothetical protein